MKYHVGHPAYQTGINQYEVLNTIHGVYAALWERGVSPLICSMACNSVLRGNFTTVSVRSGFIEVQRKED
jgi:putative copper export protein